MAKDQQKRKKFRVAVSGSTVDGREISSEHLKAAAEHYNPDVYGARVNVEHILSPLPSSEFSAMGDVAALSTEDITEGPLAGQTALYAEIEPSERMQNLLSQGKKIYSSIELQPEFALTGGPYLIGLAMTDTPASLGTERLKFTAQQRQAVMTFNSVRGEAPLFSCAIEAEIGASLHQHSNEGTRWFNRVMNLIGKTRDADSEQFRQIRDALENVASAHATLIDRFSAQETLRNDDRQKIDQLSREMGALRTQLETRDSDPVRRFHATGGTAEQTVDY